MTQTNLEILPASPYSTLVTLTWGDGHIARYCRWTSDITINGDVFIHEPSLKVFYDTPFGGGTSDSPVDVQIRTSKPPFNTLSLPFKHAKVDVLIEEVVPGDDTTRQALFGGRVGKVRVNPDGNRNLTRARILGVKARLKASCGMQALPQCVWIFGKKPCEFSLLGNTVAGTISELNTGGVPNRLKVTIPSPADMQNDRWARGFFLVDGLYITIRKSYNDSQWRFELREIPPPDWLNAAVVLYPGCKKTLAVCTLHGQVNRFMGVGIAMPDRNPEFSSD